MYSTNDAYLFNSRGKNIFIQKSSQKIDNITKNNYFITKSQIVVLDGIFIKYQMSQKFPDSRKRKYAFIVFQNNM
jgi:hypothetical protein